MGRAQKLKQARRELEQEAKKYKKPIVGKYDGSKWWQIAISIFWPKILEPQRAKVQAGIDARYNGAIKRAVKKVSHKVANRAKEARYNV